jgi:hypothetical protein
MNREGQTCYIREWPKKQLVYYYYTTTEHLLFQLVQFCTRKKLENNLNTTTEWYIMDENMVNGWTDYGFLMKKYSKSSRQELPWPATCPLNHATVVIFQLYISRLLVPPFFWGTTSKGRGSFASAMSLSTQAKLRMNFQVSLLMKNNPLYIVWVIYW